MRKTVPYCAAVWVLVSCSARNHAPAPTAPPPDAGAATDLSAGGPDLAPPAATVKILGYYTGTQASYDAIGSFAASLNMVSADLYDVTSDGKIVGSDDLGVIARDQSDGIDTFACISNFSGTLGDFDPALGHAAMVTYKDAVIAGALAIARTGYRGINIDFESLAYSTNIADDRAAYTTFIHDLATQLHAAGFALVVSVAAKTSDTPTDAWGYPFDFAAIGPDVDYVQIMTYDENGPGWSTPGPVAGLDWVDRSLAYATSVMSPSKILIGLPAYGYDWDLTASTPSKSVGADVPWIGTAALLAMPGATVHVDAATGSPYVDYTAADGHKHEAWYETADTVVAKTKLAARYHLGGVSMWALGDEDAAFWQAVHAGL
jgi:spore germination protein YaaH